MSIYVAVVGKRGEEKGGGERGKETREKGRRPRRVPGISEEQEKCCGLE